jgi:hypothetical protein
MGNFEGTPIEGTEARKKRGEGMRQHRRTARTIPENAIITPDSTPMNDSLSTALENLSIPKEVKPIAPEVKIETPKMTQKEQVEPVEKKENPITILEGINQAGTIPEILTLVRKAFKNETKDEVKRDYTGILDTLERVIKATNNPEEKVPMDRINILSKNFGLRDRVINILGPEKIAEGKKEATPEKIKPKKAEKVNKQKIVVEQVPVISDTPEDFAEERVAEVKAFVDKSVDNMSVKALMQEFALDKETAKAYLAKSLGAEIVTSTNNETTEEEKEEEPTEENTTPKEQVVLSDEKIAALNTAFDTQGFLEFLAKNPDTKFDIEDTNNAEKVLKLHEAFLVKNEVSKGMSGIVSEELNDLVGISDPESVISLEDYLSSQSYEDPDKIIDYKNQLDILKNGRADIDKLQKEVAKIDAELPLKRKTTDEEADLEMLNTTMDAGFIGPIGRKIMNQFAETGKMLDAVKASEKHPVYSAVAGLKLFFVDVPYALYQLTQFNSKENKALKAEARAKIKSLTGEEYSSKAVGKYMEKILEQKAKSTELNKLERDISVFNTVYDAYKKNVATEMLKIEDVNEAAGKKIKKAISKVMETGGFDLASSDKAQGILSKVQKVMAENGDMEFLNVEELADLQEEIDKKSQEMVLKQIQNTMETNKKSKGKFSDIEKALKGILEKNKIGSKEGTEIRKMMKEALVTVAKKYNDPVTTIKIKAFILTNKL